MIVLPYRTRRNSGHEFRPAHQYTIMFKLAGGDYYHVPAAQVQQICPGLRPMIDQAVQNGTAMTDVFEVPSFLEQDWKDWWTINDYIVQGKSHTCYPKQIIRHSCCETTTYEPISSFLTDAQIHILSTHHGLDSGAEAAAAATHERAAEILDCITDTDSLFDTREALFHLESLVAAARLACQWEGVESPAGGRTHTGELRAMVAAACATLGPLLAELPALREAVAADGRFAMFWRDLEGPRLGAGGLLTPEVRERMRWVVESCEV